MVFVPFVFSLCLVVAIAGRNGRGSSLQRDPE